MDILKDMNDAEVRALANSKTPEPMAGVWVLMAPDGQTWTAASPIKCMHAEINARVPPQVALARIRRGLMDDEPIDCQRIELVTAVQTLASHYENALGAFGDDDEGRHKAEGDIAHAMKIAAKYNQNGAG